MNVWERMLHDRTIATNQRRDPFVDKGKCLGVWGSEKITERRSDVDARGIWRSY